MKITKRTLLYGLWRIYRVVVFPVLHSLCGGGTLQGCRHQPTCSEFALTELTERGFLRGSWSAGRRVLGCHPWATPSQREA